MQVRVPTQVTVLGTVYEIKYLDSMPDLHGETLLTSKVININIGHESRSELVATIFHETMHAVLWESGMTSVIDDSPKEEGIIRALENALKEQYKISSGIYSKHKTIQLTGNNND